MACSSSNFYGTQILVSPPTPKTTKTTSIPIALLSDKRFRHFNSHSVQTRAALATILLSSMAPQAMAVDSPPPPPVMEVQPSAAEQSSPFAQSLILNAPNTADSTPKPASDLPEGSNWRYSEFLNAVKKGKVERVRFAKDGSVLQLTAVDGRRASVVVPNDPDLIDILAMNGVDISVSEGEGGNGLFGIIGNLLFPVLAFAGLFFLFRRAGGGPGGPGGMGGPMDFGRSKSKFQVRVHFIFISLNIN